MTDASMQAGVGADAIARAVAALKVGRAVVFPTDTVYGLGVAVRHAESPREIYELKRRDAGKPIAWLVGSPDDLDRYGVDVPAAARERVADQWPGALTVIVNASDAVPPAYRSSRGTIGLRMPASPVALALIDAVGPLATSSANGSGFPAPRTFAEVAPDLLDAVAVAVEDSRPASGVPSAVIDCTQEPPRLIR